MGKYKLNGCGNCAYDCCCKCEIKSTCFHCRNCQDDCYALHYVCYDCCRAWKTDEIKILNQMSRREGDQWRTNRKSPACSQCGKEGYYVNYSTRVPKKTDVKAWEILKVIQDPELFKDSKPSTLARKWIDGDGVGCTRHMTNEKKAQFWVPKRMSELNDWIKYMNNTKIK